MTDKQRRRTWQEVLTEYLIPYRDQHGDLLVPVAYKAPDGFGLGEWVKKKRAAKAAGKLDPTQIRTLERAGMVWTARGLDAWAGAASVYHSKHGHLRVPQEYKTPSGVLLGRRIGGARQSLRTGTLPEETKAFLDSLDPQWAQVDRTLTSRTCEVEGCDQGHMGRGLCRKHYNEWYLHGR